MPGVLQSMGPQRIVHDLVAEQQISANTKLLIYPFLPHPHFPLWEPFSRPNCIVGNSCIVLQAGGGKI